MWPHVVKVYTTAFPSLKCEAALLCLSLLFLFYSLSFHLPRASSVNLEFLLLFFFVRRLWGLALFPLLPSHMLSYLTTQPASHLPLHRTPHRGAKAGGIENPRLLQGNFMGVRVPPTTGPIRPDSVKIPTTATTCAAAAVRQRHVIIFLPARSAVGLGGGVFAIACNSFLSLPKAWRRGGGSGAI